MKIIVNITCWRRPNYLEKTILALKECYKYSNFSYRVLVDAGYPYQQKLMKEIITKHDFKCEFFVHNKRMGCAGNVGYAFLSSFDSYKADAVIMLEDDTVPSRDFLAYMRDMLEKFSEDTNIWSITGYNRRVYNRHPGSSDHHSISIGPGKKNLIFSRSCFTKMGGWGSWARCRNEIGNEWFGIHWNHRDGISENSCPKGKEFLNYIIKDDTGSWAWPMCMYWRGDRKEIAPDVSRIQNIGEDAGMFAPGGDWHKNNHHSEIWMDGKNIIPSEEYKWILGECSQHTASRKTNSFEKLSNNSKNSREIKRILNQIQSFTLPVFNISKDFSLKVLYILESLDFYNFEKHKSNNTKGKDLSEINDNLFKLINSFLEEFDSFNVINFGPSQTGFLQKYEPFFNKLYLIDFSFALLFKSNIVQKQTELKVFERVNYCNFYAKRFENISLIYSYDTLSLSKPSVTKRVIKTICKILCRNGIGILHISLKRNSVSKIKGLNKTNSFLSENDLVAIIQNEKCTIIDIFNSNSMNLSRESDSLFFVFRKNR